ncbi:MAG TPA: MBL fold metallo-hydrolase [Bryobacteraceae bacterium]|nr:MBL fold metallo-hydrolase [Bryobacteraceae bacterium]
MNRRELLQSAAAGALTLWAPRLLNAQQPATKLTGTLTVLNAGGANVTAFSTGEAFILVDSGAPGSADTLTTELKGLAPNGKVQTLFNTHYHLDQTANNEQFAKQGAKIISQTRTKEWMATDYWVPADDRFEKARPSAALPTETFRTKGSMKAGNEEIDYGYLLMAHTSGDMYVHFKDANVIVVGDVASPVRDPELDWFTGGWVGGRVDSMDLLLSITNDQTRFVPAFGPVMTKAQFKTERDLMEEVRQRIFDHVRAGEGPQDMLEGGALDGLPRKWKDPMKFLYAAARGAWAYHDKLGANVV